jgi:Flp pilus assembly protein TadG
MRRMTSAKRFRAESGEALVEMALVLPILIVLSMGMLDFGRAFHTKSLLDQAAREGARVAVVTAPDVGIVQGRVSDVLATGGVTAKSTTVSAVGPDRMVTVTVTTTFTFVTPGVFTLIGASYGNTINMTGKSTMRFEGGS